MNATVKVIAPKGSGVTCYNLRPDMHEGRTIGWGFETVYIRDAHEPLFS